MNLARILVTLPFAAGLVCASTLAIASTPCRQLQGIGHLVFHTFKAGGVAYNDALKKQPTFEKKVLQFLNIRPPRGVLRDGRVVARPSVGVWRRVPPINKVDGWYHYCNRFGRHKITKQAAGGLGWLVDSSYRAQMTRVVLGKGKKGKRGRNVEPFRGYKKMRRSTDSYYCKYMRRTGAFVYKRLKGSTRLRNFEIRRRSKRLSDLRRFYTVAPRGSARAWRRRSSLSQIRGWQRYCSSIGFPFSSAAIRGMEWLVSAKARRLEANANRQLNVRPRRNRIAVPKVRTTRHFFDNRSKYSKFRSVTKPPARALWKFRFAWRAPRAPRRLKIKARRPWDGKFGKILDHVVYTSSSTRRLLRYLLKRRLKRNESVENLYCSRSKSKYTQVCSCRGRVMRQGRPVIGFSVTWHHKQHMKRLTLDSYCGGSRFCQQIMVGYKDNRRPYAVFRMTPSGGVKYRKMKKYRVTYRPGKPVRVPW